ncbi:MAG: NAD-dependent epimerase/dehydratase family protein [Candidatus Omnitrophica bacterium]|nr:NAD-dependent epimerase/dehydratase family protein [Candidatus Omnitrophota bacterium]
MKRTVLVTGAAGFIGSFVADELIQQGFKVVALDDLSGGYKSNVNPKAVFYKGSILDRKLIDTLFKKYRFQYVFHLAAYAAEGLSHFIKRFNYENNLIGSVNLINASVNYKVECFVFTSSIAVYGTNQLPMVESLTPEPEDPYGIAKLAVEAELKASHHMFGLDYIIFRPHNVYGERQNIADKYRNVIGIFMNQYLQGKPLSIFGDGKQTRAFTYIQDVAPIIAKSVRIPKARNQVFNIGADKKYTVNRLAQEVIKAMGGANRPIQHLEARREVKHAYSDHSKIEKVFSYKPSCDLQLGIGRMAEWVKQHGAKKSQKFKNIEILENLPASWRQ